MADNQILPNALASFLGGLASGLVGGIIATKFKKPHPEKVAPSPKLIPLEGKGHYYKIPLVLDFCWVDDLCLAQLFPSAEEVREVSGDYVFLFRDNLRVWLRVCSLVAPQQVGRLFEVRGASSVRVLMGWCKILADHEEAEEVSVRMVGATLENYKDQLEGERKRPDARR